MGGDAGRVLYIGKSNNLRHRLGSYKNARPDRAPRKVIRLVHSVRSIVWEECETDTAARLRENQLLRTHRPKFNVMNTWPRANAFINLKTGDAGMKFSVCRELKPDGNIYGAFKNGCVHACHSLVRLLWLALHQPHSLFDLPAPLLRSMPFVECLVPSVHAFSRETWLEWTRAVEGFLEGTSLQLIQMLADSIPAGENISLFQRNLHAADLEIITSFYERGPRQNHELRTRHEITGPIIPQEELDDWLVIAGQS
jgi:excinuclease UvrABC nuclease subunit